MTCRSTSDPLNVPFTEQPENIYINFKEIKYLIMYSWYQSFLIFLFYLSPKDRSVVCDLSTRGFHDS